MLCPTVTNAPVRRTGVCEASRGGGLGGAIRMSNERSLTSRSSSPTSNDISSAAPSGTFSGLLSGSAALGATFGERLKLG